MPTEIPMFPLNSVLFPGVTVPLRVFEERYKALVRDLQQIDDPADRIFGSVAIREGYEVGDHGAQSLYRVGVRLQLTEITEADDGTYDVLAVGRDRIRLDRLTPTEIYPVGEVTDLVDDHTPVPEDMAVLVKSVFTAYRHQVGQFATDPHPGTLPRDPEWLAWALAASVPLPMSDRQALLETGNPVERLEKLAALLRTELQALNVVPSLPATDVARNRWSPN